MLTLAAVHAQGCFPKLGRVLLGQARITVLQTPKAASLLARKTTPSRRQLAELSRQLSYWTLGRVRCRVVRSLLFTLSLFFQQFAFFNLRDQQLQGTGLLGLVHAAPLIIRGARLLTC